MFTRLHACTIKQSLPVLKTIVNAKVSLAVGYNIDKRPEYRICFVNKRPKQV